ncbi:LamG-like jellyroll fold domain-containing protein [Aquimarina sp. SS2-1]|uniref:LamG domain-containing protein n=1 Tax=Aquimarina besae TaxID=3342247 RepID=UPI003671EBEC
MKKAFLIIGITMISFWSFAQSVNDGLVAYFPFDGNALDQTANSNHGSVIGAVPTTDRLGMANSAYSFNGSNSYIQVGTNGIDVTQGTISAWIKPTRPGTDQNHWMLFDTYPTSSYTAQRIVLWKGGTGGSNGTSLICGINSWNDITFNISHWDENVWHHVVMRWRAKNDGSDFISLFVDGIKVAEKNNLSKIMNTILATANIGKHYVADGAFFAGDLDDYRVYNRTLSDSEVATLYSENGSDTNNQTDPNTATDPSNVFVGTDAGTNNTSGLNNVFVGASAGLNNTTGNGNIYIGNRAGETIQGDNKLFIHNDGSEIPLIYGDFATDQLGVNTNTIPDGYNFAVGGSTSIDGDLRSSRIEVEAPDNPENWVALNVGRKIDAYNRNFNFSVSPSTSTNERLGFSVIDKNSIVRQDGYFRDDFSRMAFKSNRNQHFFTLDHNDREGQDRAAIQMPLTNSKVVIAGYGDYLEDQNHKFIVKDGTALIENAIYTNGRIAIGTTEEDPGYALTVKGKLHVQEVKVDLLGVIAPDYVFYEDYKLKTLKEVEDYIDQEGHLPNIPSASEMEAQGVNLKEMNMKLLEKVEELTLYTIAQEKAIKEQKEANDALEKRLQKLEKLLQK